MRSNPLTRLGLFVVAVILVIIGCQAAEEEAPLGILPFDWVPATESIPADGISQLTLTVTVITDEGKRVQNVAVTFRSVDASDTNRTLGSLSQATVTTDANGQATTYLTSIESAADTVCIVDAAVTDTSGYVLNPKTGASVNMNRAPPGSMAIVSVGPLSDEELEARLHTILLNRAYERAQERRKGMGALLGGDPQGGNAAGSRAAEAEKLTVIFEGVVIDLTSNKSELPSDGVSNAQITATVATTSGVQVGGVELRFVAREGTITPTAVTNEFGIAKATLTSAVTDSSQDRVVARMGATLTDTLFQDYVKPVLTISADDASLPADGNSTTNIRARLLTTEGIPVVGAEVAFSLTGLDDVSLTVQGATNSDGEAIATLKAGQTSGTVTVTATFSSLQVSTSVILLGLNVTLGSEKTSILADGNSTTKITLVAKTQTTNVAVVGQQVTFATDSGTIPATAVTNQSGVAEVTLKSGTTAGTATVTAQIGGVSVQTQVQFTSTANVSVELSSEQDRLLRDGQDETTITATVVDGNGSPLAGRVVDFSLSGGGSLSTSQPQQTSSDGKASVKLQADAATTDNTATIIAMSEGESDTLDVLLRGVTLQLSASLTSMVANGTNTSKITLLLKETTNNTGVPSRIIQFSATAGTIPATATTSASGVAQVTLTVGTSPATATVTAALGTLTTTTTVDFIAEALSLNLSADKGSILRDGIATTKVTITVQDPNGNLLNNRDVTWSVSGSGSLFPTVGQTGKDGNPSGTHSTTLTADAGDADATANVTVTVGDSTSSVAITLEGITLTSFVQPDTILANGIETALFTWQASKTSSGAVIAYHDILITNVSGPSVLLTDVSSTTNANGIATATVKSTTNAGDLVLQAELGGVTQSQSLHLLQDQFSVALTSSDATLLRDGYETANLTATVLDLLGDPVNDQRVDFTLTGSGTLSGNFSKTNSSGEANVTLMADVGSTNESAQIRASVSTAADSITIPLYGVALSIRIDPDSLVADGEDYVTVEVTVKETGSSTPLIDRLVTFAFSPGTFATITPAAKKTNNSGIATATLTARTSTSQTGWVKGRLGDDPSTTLVDSISISIVAPVRNVSLSSADDGILRNNQDSTTLTALVTDNTGYPVSGQSVAWSLISSTPSGVSLSVSSSETGGDGKATVTLTGDSGTSDATASVRAATGSSADTLNVTLQGISLTLTALPKTITANGVGEAEVEATLKEVNAGRGILGETLTFTTTLGTIGGTKDTDVNGKAMVKLIADTTSGTATITVYSGPEATGISASTTVELVDPTVTSISLAASTADLQVKGTGGIETASITATVLDRDNQPVPSGVEVEFTLSPAGSGTFGGTATVDTAETDAGGEAVVQFQSGTVASDVTVTAKVLGTSVESSTSLLTVVAGPTTDINITATIISWNDDGLYEREIHAVFSDAFSNAIKDARVYWKALPLGIGSIIGSDITDENGVAHSKFIYGRGNEPSTVIYYATNQGVTDSLVIPTGTVFLTPSTASILRDGTSNVELSVTVYDGYGTPVGLLGISWSVSAGTGSVAASGTATNLKGDATTNYYTGDANSADGSGTVQATFSGLSDTAVITLRGVTMTVSASPDTLSANGQATSTVTAVLKETTANVVLASKEVTFSSSNLGTITGSAITDTYGKATATFTAGTTAGTATVTAFYGSLSPTDQIVLTSSTAAAIALEASETSLQVKETGGTELSTITATVKDSLGNLVPAGIQVNFTVSPAGTFSNGLNTSTVLTNASGQASVIYQSGTTPGDMLITATSGGATGSTVLITVAPGPANQILISYDPADKTSGGGFSTVPIGALVSDAYGNTVVDDTQVYFQITVNPDRGAIVPMATTTDGFAQAALKYPDYEIDNTLTVKATTLGGTISATIVVTLP